MLRLEELLTGWDLRKCVESVLWCGLLESLGSSSALLWSKALLSSCRDGTIVSGDSLGMVKFWDSRTCTQLSSFQAHGADVLCMTIGPVIHLCFSPFINH